MPSNSSKCESEPILGGNAGSLLNGNQHDGGIHRISSVLFGRHINNDYPFLIQIEGKTITYKEFVKRTAKFANVLSSLGLRPGDRIAAQIEKSPDNLALVAATIQAGMVFLPLNTAYTIDEVTYFIENSEAALLVCSTDRAADLARATKALGITLATLDNDVIGSLAEMAESALSNFLTVDRGPDDLAALLYTSGTTGRSKGAMLTQKNLLSNAKSLVELWQFTDKDVLLHALPIYHTHGLFVATNVLALAGGSMILIPKFELADLLRFFSKGDIDDGRSHILHPTSFR